MENLTTHKVAGVNEAIKSTGGVPRLSSHVQFDLYPIEQLVAKIEALLRKAAAGPWTS